MNKKHVAEDSVARELSEIKKLMVLMLLREGATQAEVAEALGVNQSSISRMFPGRLGKVTKATASK